ncbi:MAG TPA: Hsp70 family protein [Gemmataceae bacterium]|nr:Hsp70 family protein [Gemmataceae bacterium]
MKIRKTIGIDLGTTNSVIAMLDATDSALITGQDEHGHKIVPSVVGYLAEPGHPVVGRAAAALKGNPGGPVASVKRHMGLERTFAVGPETLTPPQVSARILLKLRELLAYALNDGTHVLDSAIITMPAYFNHNQIEATRQAGELAGFEVVELLHEPTAAAIYYSWLEGHGDATYLVYDLGGGTFDVSVIRKRFSDYEVLSVSGDPFLGGDDFDRLLASHLAEPLGVADDAPDFSKFVAVAEGVKIDLTTLERVERFIPDLLTGADGRTVSLAVDVDRATFQRLIKDKVARTIDCCHEALARARDKAGLRLCDIDYLVLVGGSSRVPLVRDTVRAAFCNPSLPEHVRHAEPLLSEPDLCVAYGAALRAATYGTRYLFPDLKRPHSFLPDLDLGLGLEEPALELEIHVTSPVNVQEPAYTLVGCVRGPGAAEVRHGGSVRVQTADGPAGEAFLEPDGAFAQDVTLRPETGNVLGLTLCDNVGQELVSFPVCVSHGAAGRALGQGVLPTQLITKPLQIEVLNRARQRVKQVVAPIGATLPGTFACTCRTVDQSGRIVVPIFEENRVIKQMVIRDLDPWLPFGSPVEVELSIDVKHNIQVRVRVKESGRCEAAAIEAPPPPRRPTQAAIDEAHKKIDELLPNFSGGYRSRVRTRVAQLRQELTEALRYDDEPKAIQRMAELRDVLDELEARQGQELDPPWPHFQELVTEALNLAAVVAEATGREREALSAHVHEQERFARQAQDERNQALYRTSWENLQKYLFHLGGLLPNAPAEGPRAKPRPADEEARALLERFRSYLAAVWKRVRLKGKPKLDERLKAVAAQAQGLNARLKEDAPAVLRELRRLMAEVYKVEQHLKDGRDAAPEGDLGLLEGTV